MTMKIPHIHNFFNEVKTLKGLKPILEARYDDERNKLNPFEMMNEMGIDLHELFGEVS